MTKHFLLLALSLFALNLSAQTWFADGQRWQYEYVVFGPIYGFEELIVEGDTMIEGQVYKNLHLRRLTINYQYPTQPPVELNRNIPVYEVNDQVYYRDSLLGDVLLYDFSAEVGAEIPLINSCEGESYEIIETGTTDVEGQLRRYQIIHASSAEFLEGADFRIIEGIGLTNITSSTAPTAGGFCYFFIHRAFECAIDSDRWNFMCYSYEDFEYNPAILDCDALEFLIIATDQPSLEGVVAVYPTVFKETVHIEKLQQTNIDRINVYNTNGLRVFHSQEESTRLQLAHLPQGMYFVELISEEGARLVQRVIRQE